MAAAIKRRDHAAKNGSSNNQGRTVSNGESVEDPNSNETANLLPTSSSHSADTSHTDEHGRDKDSQESLSWRGKFLYWLRTPSISHVLIIALLGSAGGGLAVPVELPVLREFACDWYYDRKQGKSGLLLSLLGPALSLYLDDDVFTNERQCNAPAIAKLAGEIITAARILNATITVLCLTVYSDLLSRFGRKPMFAFTAFCLMLSIALFGIGARVRGSMGIILITLSFALTGLGSQPLLQLTFQSYIVECVKSKERSPAFSLLGSATFAGLAVSALASAGITKYSHIPLLPFWIGTGVFALMFLYSCFILPEALTEARQKELMQANDQLYSRPASPDTAGENDSSKPVSSKWTWLSQKVNFVKKLGIFLPRRNEDTGRKDYRLFFLAIAFTIYRIGSMYMNDLLLLTTTGTFGFNGVDNGLLIGFITALKAALLMGLLPIVIRIGRAKYINWLAHRSSVHPTMEGLTESSRLLGNGGSQSAQRRPHVARTTTQERIEGSERFDLYFGGLSFLVDAVGFTAIGLSKRRWHLYASTALLSLSAAGGPSAQAVATEVAPESMSDQVLGALSLIDEAGAILSPLVVGSIYSASAETHPSLAWFISAALLVISALIILSTPNHRPRR